MKLKFTFLIPVIFLSVISFAQQSRNIDSLINIINTSENDSIKLRAVNQVSFYYFFNDLERAIQMLNPAIDEALEKGLIFNYNELINTKGNYYNVKGIKDSAKFFYEKSIQLSRDNDFKSIEQMALNNLGLYYWSSGNFQSALDQFYSALDINTRFTSENKEGKANYLSNIGLIYQELKQNDKAIEHHKKALEIREELNLEAALIISNANLGVCYKNILDYDKSIMHYNRAIDYAKKANNLRLYHAIHDNLANLYFELEDYEKAISLYKKSLDRPASVGSNPKSDLSTYSNLVAAYKTINQPREALSYAQKGFEIVENDPTLKSFAATLYKNAAESHYMLGDINTGSELLAGYITINDSIFSKNNADALAGYEVKFETHQKEIQLAETRAALAENELKIGRKNMLIYGTSALALLLAILGYLLYKQQKLQNRQLQKENELREALSQIETQNKLQEQRLRISRDLHDNIGAQLTFIISTLENIKYGFKLQNDKLGEKLQSISNFTSNTIFELRDTIWAMNKTEISFEDLNARITNFIDKARETSEKTGFSFEVSDELNSKYLFTSIEGMNIYRIIQESVHNALKYAEAKNISVEIKEIKDDIVISIQDDGKGFDLNNAPLGNGLNNIRKRTKEINGQLNIESSLDRGTKIFLNVRKNTYATVKRAS
jgi:signal transduction histidine kinase